MLLKIQNFIGEVPRLPGHLLPENAAQFANNCDFLHGELRGLRDNRLLYSIPQIPLPQFATSIGVSNVYTENGVDFFGWPWDVDVVKGQVFDDRHHRIFYTAQPSDGPIIKVARTYREGGTKVINTPLVGGNFMPPENSTVLGNGPDSWILGIPEPKAQNVAASDKLVASLDHRKSWPNVPRLKLKATLFWENAAGEIVHQFDCSSTDEAWVDTADHTKGTYPQVTYSIDASNNDGPAVRGNKIQDFMWAVNKVTPQPYKEYFMQPPALDGVSLSRTVTVTNTDASAIVITYGTATPDTIPPPIDGA